MINWSISKANYNLVHCLYSLIISSNGILQTGQHSHLYEHATQAKLWPQGINAASDSAQ